MSLPFRLDQADSLVITKEDRLALSVNAKPIETVVSSFLSLRSKDRHCDSEMSCERVSALQRANIELSSKLLRIAMQQLHELKRWNACILYCIPTAYWCFPQKHTVGLLTVSPVCEAPLWAVEQTALCSAHSEILPTPAHPFLFF